MNLFLIVVEFKKQDEENLERLYDFVCRFGTTVQLTDLSFLLKTKESAVEIRDNLKISLDPYRIFVTKVLLPSAWSNIMQDSSEVKRIYRE